MAEEVVIFVGNTTVLEVTLTDALTDTSVNSATVSVTISDIAGTPLTGETWPKALPYVTSSSGLYRGIISSDLDILADTTYKYEATAVKDGITAKWGGTVMALLREF